MHREGHIGAALAAWSPFALVLAAVGAIELAVFSSIGAAAISMLPDYDQKIPLVKHRGRTHTVHFALVVGAVFGVLGVLLGLAAGPLLAVGLGIGGALFGTVTMLSHIAADALTPAGVDPYATGSRISYDVARAGNPIANWLLLGIGVIAIVVAVAIGASIGGIIGTV